MADVTSPSNAVAWADLPVGKYAKIIGGGPLAGQFLVKAALGATLLNVPSTDITAELGAYTYQQESTINIINA